MADHDVPEDNDPNGNEAVEAEEKSDEETSKPAEDFSKDMAAVDRVRGAIDEEYEGETDDLENAVADDHLVHPVLLLLHDDHHRPGVEVEGKEKDGEGDPKQASRDLRMISVPSHPNKIVDRMKLCFCKKQIKPSVCSCLMLLM